MKRMISCLLAALLCALPLCPALAAEPDGAEAWALLVGVLKPIDSTYPYAPEAYSYVAPAYAEELGLTEAYPPDLPDQEETQRLRAIYDPHVGYAPADLGLEAAAVRSVRPVYFHLASRFYDACCVFLADPSPAAAEAAARAVGAAPGVFDVAVLPEYEARRRIAEGHEVIVGVDFSLGVSPALSDFGADIADLCASAVPAYDPPPSWAKCAFIALQLKDPTRENVVALVGLLREKPFVWTAGADDWTSLDTFLECDADADGRVTAADARQILRLAVGLASPATRYEAHVADVDYSGKPDAGDARKALRVAVGLEPECWSEG